METTKIKLFNENKDLEGADVDSLELSRANVTNVGKVKNGIIMGECIDQPWLENQDHNGIMIQNCMQKRLGNASVMSIRNCSELDFSSINNSKVEKLSIRDCDVSGLDVSTLKKLEFLHLTNCTGFKFTDCYVSNIVFDGDIVSFVPPIELPNIKSMVFTKSKIKNCDFVQSYPTLERVLFKNTKGFIRGKSREKITFSQSKFIQTDL